MSLSFNVTGAAAQQTHGKKGISRHLCRNQQTHAYMYISGAGLKLSCGISPSSSSSVRTASLEYMARRRLFRSISVILAASVSWRRNEDKLLALPQTTTEALNASPESSPAKIR